MHPCHADAACPRFGRRSIGYKSVSSTGTLFLAMVVTDVIFDLVVVRETQLTVRALTNHPGFAHEVVVAPRHRACKGQCLPDCRARSLRTTSESRRSPTSAAPTISAGEPRAPNGSRRDPTTPRRSRPRQLRPRARGRALAIPDTAAGLPDPPLAPHSSASLCRGRVTAVDGISTVSLSIVLFATTAAPARIGMPCPVAAPTSPIVGVRWSPRPSRLTTRRCTARTAPGPASSPGRTRPRS